MRRPTSTASLAALLLVVLLLPAALASWSSKAGVEPDTSFDEGFVWDGPPPASSSTRIYFNGFAGAWAGSPTGVNPNAAAGARVQPVPFSPSAILGVWVDCNGDGYIGHAAIAAVEYHATLLPAGGPCPVAPSPGGLTHNDGEWIQELFPIGYDDVRTSDDENPFHIQDQAARVWADWGAPGARQQDECGDVPLPRGSLRSTGALVGVVDCRLAHQGIATWDAAAHAAGQHGLAFDDAPRDRPGRSASPLNVENPWGHEEDAPFASAVDCDGEPTETGVSDPTDDGTGEGDLHTVTVPVVGFSFNATDSRGRFVNASTRPLDLDLEPSGSPAGTVNATQAQASDCDRADRDSVLTYEGERRGSDATGPYVLESSAEAVSSDDKRSRTDFAFTYEEGVRDPGALGSVLGERWQSDAGTGHATVIGTWTATSRSTRDPVLSRAQVGPEPVTLVTYYAFVSKGLRETLALDLPGGLGVYGTDCDVYECDARAWWRNEAGALVVPRDARLGADPLNPARPMPIEATELGVRAGQVVVARDTDCYDASVSAARASGLHWGVLTATACA